MSKRVLTSIFYIVIGNFLIIACQMPPEVAMKIIVTKAPLSLCDFLLQELSHHLIQGRYHEDNVLAEIANLYEIERGAIQRDRAAYPNDTWLLQWTVQDDKLGLINYGTQMTNRNLDSIEITAIPFISIDYDKIISCLGVPSKTEVIGYSLDYIVPADLVTLSYYEKLQVIRLIRPKDVSSLVETKMFSLSVHIDERLGSSK